MKKIYVNLKDWLNKSENENFAAVLEGMGITVFPALPYLYLYTGINGILVGAQDASAYESGAHNGDVSLEHLKEFGVSHVILNHRENCTDDYSKIKEKIKRALEANITALLCVKSVSELETIDQVLYGLDWQENVYIAYEPENDTSMDTIKDMIEIIRNKFKTNNIIYGGNISLENIDEYNGLNVSGFLISRHAIDAEELKKIIERVN